MIRFCSCFDIGKKNPSMLKIKNLKECLLLECQDLNWNYYKKLCSLLVFRDRIVISQIIQHILQLDNWKTAAGQKQKWNVWVSVFCKTISNKHICLA